MVDVFTDQAQLKSIMPAKKINFGLLYMGLLIFILGIVYYFREKNGITVFVSFNKLWSILLIFAGLSIIAARTFKMVVLGVFLTLSVLYISVLTLVQPVDYLQIIKDFNNIELRENQNNYDILLENKATNINLNSANFNDNIEYFFESNYTNLKAEILQNENNKIIYKNNEIWKGVGNYYKNLNISVPKDNSYKFIITGEYNNIDLVLNNLKVNNLIIDSRLSNINIDLKDISSDIDIDINTTLSLIKLKNIQDIGVEMIVNIRASNLSIGNLVKAEDEDKIIYKSNDFDSKSKKVKINLNTKFSSIEVK